MEAAGEWARRARRLVEARRRPLLALALVAFLALYMAPAALRLLRRSLSADDAGAAEAERCLEERLRPYREAEARGDAAVSPRALAQYVGNGRVALAFGDDERLRVRGARSPVLSLPIDFRPLVDARAREGVAARRAVVVDYLAGVVRHVSCSADGVVVERTSFAHRAAPFLFVQKIEVTNPTRELVEIRMHREQHDWPTVRTVKFRSSSSHERDAEVFVGSVDATDELEIAVAAAATTVPIGASVRPRSTSSFEILTIVERGEPLPRDRRDAERTEVERRCVARAERAEELAAAGDLLATHSAAWRRLWTSGFSITRSLAHDALNGDRVNATVYTVLSQVGAPEFEEDTTSSRKPFVDTDGCYAGHHTLQAANLWRATDTAERIDSVARSWLLTLEKQGCRAAVAAGASAVAQAMLLSFGGLRFTDRHLEFDAHPSDLHRDFEFRRIHYGETTLVNVTVTVGDDDKAALHVALDRADGAYYACDGGCLDGPVALDSTPKYFPVKLTDPPTPILYIASDRRHLEELRHAIHVKEVAVAPAHEHHVLAMHRHGHTLGALPTLFWVTVCFVIVLFHLFLCRIVMTEYCDPPDKYRKLYDKP